MELEWLFAAIILLGILFVATIDIAFSHVTDVGMRRLSSEQEAAGHKNASALLREILENRARFRFLLSSAIQILLVLFVVVVTVSVAPLFASGYMLMLVALAISMFATALFRQVLPRLIVRRDYEKTLLRLLPIIRPLHRVALTITSPFVFRPSNDDDARLDETSTPDSATDSSKDNNDDLTALMEVGEAEGIIEEDEREMIETMVEFGETRAGEIEDEDIEREEVIEIRDLGNGVFDVLGSTEIERVEELFDLELEDDDYTTIAGLVVTEHGSVPKVGDDLTLKGLAIEIIEADEKRLTLLRLKIADTN